MTDESIEIEVMIEKETEKAYLLSRLSGPDDKQWFPKSQVSFKRRNIKTNEATAIIPDWLLDDKDWYE